jgi:biopolymer transport protein TolR
MNSMARELKMRRQRRSKRALAEINIVPYIDVMLVLLVIFMITTPLLTQGVKVNLPSAKAETLAAKPQPPIIVTVDAKGLYYINTNSNPEQVLSPQALSIRIAAELQFAQRQGQERQVLVKGDRDVAYGRVVQAMVLLQNAGVPQVGLMTEDNH